MSVRLLVQAGALTRCDVVDQSLLLTSFLAVHKFAFGEPRSYGEIFLNRRNVP
jgi:hypothetical protein